jgi:hypothetical protein
MEMLKIAFWILAIVATVWSMAVWFMVLISYLAR